MTGALIVHVVLASLAAVLPAYSVEADIGIERLAGRPQFSEGDALGYFIWKDGDTFKLRWTTFGANHRFSGRIVVEGGEFRSFKRIDPDTERKVLVPGRAPTVRRGPAGRVRSVRGGRAPVVATRNEDIIVQETEQLIRFNTATDDDLDGVEFQVTGDAVLLRFVLEIDGEPRPAEVEVGRGNFKPAEHPLVVRLR